MRSASAARTEPCAKNSRRFPLAAVLSPASRNTSTGALPYVTGPNVLPAKNAPAPGMYRSNLCLSLLRLFWEKTGRDDHVRHPQRKVRVSLDLTGTGSSCSLLEVGWDVRPMLRLFWEK